MKSWTRALFLVAAFLVATCYGAYGQALKTDKEKASYAVGAQMGAEMRHYRMDLDPDMVAKGLDQKHFSELASIPYEPSKSKPKADAKKDAGKKDGAKKDAGKKGGK